MTSDPLFYPSLFAIVASLAVGALWLQCNSWFRGRYNRFRAAKCLKRWAKEEAKATLARKAKHLSR